MDATLTSPLIDATHETPVNHPRLAELVVHLTGCPAQRAVAAVNRASVLPNPLSNDDKLRVVAEAMVGLRRIDLRERSAR
jgi:hypothetical protein